jgi:hypothetical protein
MQFVVLWLFSLFTMASFKRANKGFRLCKEADYGAQNCQYTTKVDAR